MTTSMAVKREKAIRRKSAVAEKRKLASIESSAGVRAQRAAIAPIRHCLIHGPVNGMANVILARGTSPNRLTVGFFLIDMFCLGIKDLVLHDFGAGEFAIWTAAMSMEAPLKTVDPSYARKLVHGAAAWASSIGFKLHRDFVAVEQIFGDVSADACNETFVFGKDGKPFYVPGPTETRSQIRQRMTHLIDRFGDGGFDYVIGI